MPPMPYNRSNPFRATLKVQRRLTAPDAERDARHYELDIAGSELEYQVGDCVGIFPRNDPALVDEILAALRASGDEVVQGHDGNALPLRDALLSHYQITQPDRKFLAALAQKDTYADSLRDMLDPSLKTKVDLFLLEREIIDLLLEYPVARFDPAEFVATLRKLQPRLYSIACSRRRHPEEIHLTVATVAYETNGRTRKGVCTSYLAERAEGPGAVPLFLHSAKHFRLPEDPAADILMVGPGTGIAPFRAFLHEREATGAPGKNWLFFGGQRRETDFFYQEEIERFLDAGVLHRISTAFSRDQAYKIYVQDRMMESAQEIWDWLERGAYFYVCGDATQMAKDVERALRAIVVQAGRMTTEQAVDYIEGLKREKRYRKDVY